MKNKFRVVTRYGSITFDSCEEFFVGENKVKASFFTEPFQGLTVYSMVLSCNGTEKKFKTTQRYEIQIMARKLQQIKQGEIDIKDI